MGHADVNISTLLWTPGTYYVLVLPNDRDQQGAYTLTLDGIALANLNNAPPVDYAFNAGNLPACDTTEVLYLTASDQLGGITSAAMTNLRFLASDADAPGLVIDFSEALAYVAPTTAFSDTYRTWRDAHAGNPFYANAFAEGINKLINDLVDRCPSIYYVAIIGGDRVIPFYRVPDETLLANESSYLPGSSINPTSETASSLRYHTILTDNIYGSLSTIPFRGRKLLLPELAVGRVVESASDISDYLYGMQVNGIDARSITIDGTKAFVSGYDFLTDHAQAVSSTITLYNSDGVPPVTLINDTWSAAELQNAWLTNLGIVVSSRSRYGVQSVNAHFTHDRAIPANYLLAPTEYVTAAVIYQNNYDPFSPQQAYLYNTLGFSVGCHSGYNVADGDVLDPNRRIDFPQAYVKQHGAWVGNTGFGYGDSDLIAYSEKLMLNFSEELGRDWRDAPNGNLYAGMPVGQALVRAKRAYLREAAAGTFSVYDEKVLLESTLYGLPTLRAKVYAPNAKPFPATDPQDFECQTCYLAGLRSNKAPVTTTSTSRTVTISFTHDMQSFANGDVVSTTAEIVSDSENALVGQRFVGEYPNAAGRPTLPAFSIPVALEDALGSQRLQDVTLIDAESGDQPFNPLVTRLITDEDYLDTEPAFNFPQQWFPDQPFASSVFESENIAAAGPATRRYLQLLLSPAQYKGNNSGGLLRTYASMTIELTYLSEGATPALLNDSYEPIIWDAALSGDTIEAVILEYNSTGPGVVVEASAFVKTAGDDWAEVIMSLERDAVDLETWYASGQVPADAASPLQVLLYAQDEAGNSGVETFGGTFNLDRTIYLPLVMK